MIFGKRSDRELKYAKAKAKATEFFVDPSSVPHFKLNSDELHYTSILTLSTYVNSRLSGDDGAEYMTDLQKVGSFYDSASNDERYREYSDGYWTLAMATYFLLGNYGSAKVCAEKVKEPDFYGARARTLYDLIMFLLVPSQPVPPDLAILADYLAGEDVDRAEVISAADSLLTEDSPEDTFFSGVLYVSISDAVSCSARALLPGYTHLDINDWRSFLSTEAAPKASLASSEADRFSRGICGRKRVHPTSHWFRKDQKRGATTSFKNTCKALSDGSRGCSSAGALL